MAAAAGTEEGRYAQSSSETADHGSQGNGIDGSVETNVEFDLTGIGSQFE